MTAIDAKLREILAQAYRDDGFEAICDILTNKESKMETVVTALRHAYAHGRETMRDEAIERLKTVRPDWTVGRIVGAGIIRAIPIMPDEKEKPA